MTSSSITPEETRRRGPLEKLDPVGQGRLQILCGSKDRYAQAVHAVEELRRIAGLVPDWDWSRAAVIAREWAFLMPVRSYCEAVGIPVQTANEELPPVWRLRETQALVAWLRERQPATVTVAAILVWLGARPSGDWWSVLRDCCAELQAELGNGAILVKDILEWIAEWGRDLRRKPTGVRFVRTGLEKPNGNIGFNPISVSLEDGVPVAEEGRKITPRAACTDNPKYRFDEAPVVASASSGVRRLAQAMQFHLRPLGISQYESFHPKLES